ncbi:Na+/H+ antiporter subunit E [Cryobacterium sp. 10I1]|uniref:Na+/H+ antiporter subunit E n=1 Tax=unclassified Cryobacterium TaxID=2649013 RepID=UPI002AC99998|nr:MULTISPECIES: Na+/H+ antiporter subunit E [unclassified Cryobacterium]MEB0285631.1 Na+/H+ antiporter subunit E [Cryobacterium sp. 10S3]MEB0306606.1 Na+/H+ antiporter subunit E [Cryobacterium sp. 10I1]WPX12763.1 Na+/H+ antiporter subunit E [Cryobacterium sp. 10S3]
MTTRAERRAALLNQLPLWLGLVLLWMLLWGSFSWLNLVTGALLAALVSVVFYLPAVQLSGRISPAGALAFLLRLFGDIVRASVQVAWLALRPLRRPAGPDSAIIAVPLRTRSDLILTWTAVATSIVPGSIVIDTDRVSSTLHLHVLNVRTHAQIDRFRVSVLATERRIVRAFGSREDLERLALGDAVAAVAAATGAVAGDARAASARNDDDRDRRNLDDTGKET